MVAALPDGAVFLPITTGKRCTIKGWNKLSAAEAAALPQWRAAVAAAVRLDGLTVVDIDAPERRAEILAGLGINGAKTLEATTPRGGAHLYFTSERRQTSFAGGDIKAGRGGYVLVCRFDGGGDYVFNGGAVVQVPASYRHPGGQGKPAANGSAPRKPSTSTVVIRAPGKLAKLREELALLVADIEAANGIKLRERAGQWEGPCPVCKAGDDRFWMRVPEQRGGPKMLVGCRQCPDKAAVYHHLARQFADAADEAVTVPCTRVHSSYGAGPLARFLLPAEPPPPPIVVAADAAGRPLLRGGQVVWLYGPPKSGKSWATLGFAAAAARAGGWALLVCFERSGETRHRLHGMLDAESALRHRVGVAGALAPADIRGVARKLAAAGAPAVVVIDSASRSGCPIDGANVQPWLASVVEPWLNPLTAVVVVDHTPRRDAQAGRNAGAIGSQTKTAAADVQYRVDAGEYDAVGRLVSATLVDTGSNALWHPRTIALAMKRGVPTLTAGEAARLITFEEACQAVRAGTSSEAAAARACGMKRSTFQGRVKKWSGT